MITRPTGTEHDPTATTHNRQIGSKATQRNLVGVKVNTATHSIDDRLGLLVYLLLHEMVEFTFHDSSDFKLERFDAASGGDLAGGLRFIILAAETVNV